MCDEDYKFFTAITERGLFNQQPIEIASRSPFHIYSRNCCLILQRISDYLSVAFSKSFGQIVSTFEADKYVVTFPVYPLRD